MTDIKNPTTTLVDLYPDGGPRYHQAHEPYLRAVADSLTAAGIRVLDWYADPNEPRDGAIRVNVFGLDYDEVWLSWREEGGWSVLLVEEHEGKEDSRWVYDLDAGNVFSPESVVRAFAEHMGIDATVPADTFSDLDFPDHRCEDDNADLELALRRYAEAAA